MAAGFQAGGFGGGCRDGSNVRKAACGDAAWRWQSIHVGYNLVLRIRRGASKIKICTNKITTLVKQFDAGFFLRPERVNDFEAVAFGL